MIKKNILKIGIIGGALNSAIGQTHFIASRMDGRFNIVAGCFSKVAEINRKTADFLDISHSRLYPDWRKFLDSERGNLDAVLILTPTPQHSEIIIEAISKGFAIISEKALCISLIDATNIRTALEEYKGFLTVTYNYSGYPMVRELRHMIESGKLGQIKHIVADMPQESFLRLVGPLNSKPTPQSWRLKDNFIPTVYLDLGVHLHHLIYFLTKANPLEVCALESRQGHFNEIIDHVQCIARYSGNIPAQISFGKTSLGYANGLRIQIFGSLAAAEWLQSNPEILTFHDNKGQTSLLSRSTNSLEICVKNRYNRFKSGHPAGFIEAFANYYFDIAESISEFQNGKKTDNALIAGIDVAEEGIRMMEAIAKSSRFHTWQAV